MTTNHAPLLPGNSTLLEKRAAECLQQAVKNPLIIADLINPQKCPEHLLPYLAWAFSVDKWDEQWSEEVKRIAIESAFIIHKQKGTLTAIKRVIEPIGYLLELKEWWQETPEGVPGTFKLNVEVSETGLNANTFNELTRLIDDVRPVSRHFTLAITITPVGNLKAYITPQAGEIITIYP